MPTTYATVAQLKGRLKIKTTETGEDTLLQEMLDGAAGAIELWTGKRFAPVAETRYYASQDGRSVDVDDLLSVATIATDLDLDGVYETTWSPADFRLLPVNAALDGRPYRQVVARAAGARRFPTAEASTRIVGSWGYAAAVPVPIREATLRMGQRLYGLKDAWLGLGGARETGFSSVIPRDKDLQDLLEPYRAWVIV